MKLRSIVSTLRHKNSYKEHRQELLEMGFQFNSKHTPHTPPERTRGEEVRVVMRALDAVTSMRRNDTESTAALFRSTCIGRAMAMRRAVYWVFLTSQFLRS